MLLELQREQVGSHRVPNANANANALHLRHELKRLEPVLFKHYIANLGG